MLLDFVLGCIAIWDTLVLVLWIKTGIASLNCEFELRV